MQNSSGKLKEKGVLNTAVDRKKINDSASNHDTIYHHVLGELNEVMRSSIIEAEQNEKALSELSLK
jgi:hypothetical protein